MPVVGVRAAAPAVWIPSIFEISGSRSRDDTTRHTLGYGSRASMRIDSQRVRWQCEE